MKSTNELFNKVMKNILLVEEDIKKDCPLAKDVQHNYEYWQKNAMNKEAALKLKNSFDKWEKKHVR
jgi:hypothetical protein